ncbi:PIN domain-containing protein [Granulicella sp. 5B5]|uniref:type II toxin-antitoxin system VapC family toxin n=1 Tax=Granulicella sp. 5B5 TaxID=1617967 RepID=UPI0015F4D229|nr:PIN domain nuclease [Granulicella sp. 5B5]QMV19026.1 PIN domain-containing protein [Granulicella sp. 5B5]
MTIVETTVWVDLLRGTNNEHTEWMKQNLGDPNLSLTDLTLCEVLQGLRLDTLHREARRMLLKFGVHSTGGAELALAASDNFRFLRKRGITVRKTIDCLIATYCIREGHVLLHHDRDYDPFEEHLGLRVIHPARSS